MDYRYEVTVTEAGDPSAEYGTCLTFADPDGNRWLVQEVRARAA